MSAENNVRAMGVTVGALRRYLRTQGWRETPLKNGRTSMFGLPIEGDVPLELFVPMHGDIPGAAAAIRAVLETLSDLGAESIQQVVARMRAIGFDTLRTALPDNLVFLNSIHLDAAEGFVKHARRLYAYAATNEAERQPVTSRISVEGDDYVSRCRFGHTFEGSFGFSIESPVGPHEEIFLDARISPPPPERRYMERIARGLKTIEAAGAASDPGLIEASYETGFNANMCDEIVRMFAATEADQVKFQVRLSPEWMPSEDLANLSTVSLGSRAIAVAREASAHLRKTEFIEEEEVTGYITWLSTRENPADLDHTSGSRDVAIDWSNDGPQRVRLRLDPKAYQEAWRAHGGHKLVRVKGRLEQRRSLWFLSNPRDFKVLD